MRTARKKKNGNYHPTFTIFENSRSHEEVGKKNQKTSLVLIFNPRLDEILNYLRNIFVFDLTRFQRLIY